MLLVGHAGGSEEVERQRKVASRPELSSTEQPLRLRVLYNLEGQDIGDVKGQQSGAVGFVAG